MIERVATELIVIAHLGFIVFVGRGALQSLRRKRIARLHLPAVACGTAIELRRWVLRLCLSRGNPR